MATVFDAALVALILGVAAWTVAARDEFAAIIGYVVYGLLLSLAWMQLAAPDVSLTEAAIGSGLTGALLLTAQRRLAAVSAPAAAGSAGPALRLGAGTLSVAVAIALAAVVLLLPEPPPSLAAAAMSDLAATALGNPVAAVLVVYRAVDTLLEAVVLLLALIGVWSLAKDAVWGGTADAGTSGDRSGVLRFMAQVLVPLGIGVGIHIVWVGSNGPGGKFQGATVLAAMWLLAQQAGLARAPATGSRAVRALVTLGPAVFLLIGFAGFGLEGGFLSYPPNLTKPLILVIEAAMTLTVAVTLGLLVSGPAARRLS